MKLLGLLPIGTGLIFISKRMCQKDEGKNQLKRGRSTPFRWSGVYITDTLDVLHECLMYIAT
jgi:hypothetical protein